MKWINQFDGLLLDFDGLLVDSERTHYQAYQDLCTNHNYTLPFDFVEYCSYAHISSDLLRQKISEKIPGLITAQRTWEKLYEEKKSIVTNLFKKNAIHLMPGVENLLEWGQRENKVMVVVTNSTKNMIDKMTAQNPILKQTIPYWLTKEDYDNPKPHPDGYLKAINNYFTQDQKILGLEDSPKGIRSLQRTKKVHAYSLITITQFPIAELPSQDDRFFQFPNIPSMMDKMI